MQISSSMRFLRNGIFCFRIHYRRAYGTAFVSLSASRCIAFCNNNSSSSSSCCCCCCCGGGGGGDDDDDGGGGGGGGGGGYSIRGYHCFLRVSLVGL